MTTRISAGAFAIVNRFNKNIAEKCYKEAYDKAAIVEIALMKYCIHPNIIQLISFTINEGAISIYMKYYDLTLSKLPFNKVTPAFVTNVCTSLSSAINYLHTNRIIHTDIKPQNILYSPHEDKIVLTDFNSAIYQPGFYIRAAIQTVYYRAPEVDFHGQYIPANYLIDIWGFGCTLYEVITGDIYNNSKNDDTSLGICAKYEIIKTTRADRLDELNLIDFEDVFHVLTADIPQIAENLRTVLAWTLIPSPARRICSLELYKMICKNAQVPLNISTKKQPAHTLRALYQKRDEIISCDSVNDSNNTIILWEKQVYAEMDINFAKLILSLEIAYYETAHNRKFVGSIHSAEILNCCMYLVFLLAGRDEFIQDKLWYANNKPPNTTKENIMHFVSLLGFNLI